MKFQSLLDSLIYHLSFIYLGTLIMQYFIKYLTSAPLLATLTLVVVASAFIELNYLFPGLQYGTYFHALP